MIAVRKPQKELTEIIDKFHNVSRDHQGFIRFMAREVFPPVDGMS